MGNAEKTRNVAIVGSFGCGKTTLVESMLSAMKAVSSKGNVDEGTSASDYDPDEIRKKISLNSSLCQGTWQDHAINIVDTPGCIDYLNDTRVVMNAVDLVVIVLDGLKGVEVTTQKLWLTAQERNIPRLLFINHLDSDQADFQRVVEDLKDIDMFRHARSAVVPIGQGEGFKGLVDLSQKKAYVWPNPNAPKPEIGDIPEELAADEEYEQFIESVAEIKEELIEKYLEEGALSAEDIQQALRDGLLSGELSLILAGSAKTNVGVQVLLDYLVLFAPAPKDRPPILCYDEVEKGQSWECRLQDEKLPCLYVFKTISDPYAGKISLFRVMAGAIKADETLYNANHSSTERLGKLFRLVGKKHEPVAELSAGDIGAVAKLKETLTGDTLLSPALSAKPFTLFPLTYPEPIYSIAIAPESKNDENKLGNCLHRLKEEDPFFQVSVDPTSRKTLIGGMGQTHVDLLVERLKTRFGVHVSTSPPKVPYRETISLAAEAQGRHKKQSGGAGQFGDVWLRLEPRDRGAGFEFESKIVGGVVPRNFWPAVEKGVRAVLEEGVLIKYPIVDVKAILYDGSYHSVDSNDLSFQLAARLSFKNAYEKAKPTILEPVLNLEITVPEEYTGDIISDLSSRRGRPLGMERSGNLQLLKAQLPMSEALGYSPVLTSITRGQGSFTAEFSHYEELPAHLKDELIAAARKQQEEAAKAHAH